MEPKCFKKLCNKKNINNIEVELIDLTEKRNKVNEKLSNVPDEIVVKAIREKKGVEGTYVYNKNPI